MPTNQFTSHWTQARGFSLVYKDNLYVLGAISDYKNQKLVPSAGIEPALPYRNQILSLARLPVPPGGQQEPYSGKIVAAIYAKANCTSIAQFSHPPNMPWIHPWNIRDLTLAWRRKNRLSPAQREKTGRAAKTI
jgi:hypothetical protein